MTDQNNAAQAAEQEARFSDDQLMDIATAAWQVHSQESYSPDGLLMACVAVQAALLSKLRSPVADLRIGVSATDQGATICIMQPHADGSATVIYSETHPIGDSAGRAALASAPVAGKTREEVDYVRGGALNFDANTDGAPVAGEAQKPLGHVAVLHAPCGARYFSRITNDGQARMCAAQWAKEYADVKPGPWLTEAVAVYAAPQASEAGKTGPWCCERAESQGVQVCEECAEISAGFQASMRSPTSE